MLFDKFPARSLHRAKASQHGRLAVIPRASGGLGHETAWARARAGARVVLTGRSPSKGAAALEHRVAERGFA